MNPVTSSSSKPRVKQDQFGDDGFQALFQAHASMTLEDFRQLAVTMIQESSGKNATKEKFVTDILHMSKKDTILKTVTNYMLAGEGRKV